MKIDIELSGANLVETRLDSLNYFGPYEDLNTLIREPPLLVLFTYRFGNLDISYFYSCSGCVFSS